MDHPQADLEAGQPDGGQAKASGKSPPLREPGGVTTAPVLDHPASRLENVSFALLVAAIEGAPAAPSRQSVIRLYRAWLAAPPAASEPIFAAWFNLGVALAANGERAEAAAAYRRALVLKPEFHPAAVNLGLSLEALGQSDAALAAWTQALQVDEARTALLNQRARLLERLGRLAEAETMLRASLLTDPEQPDAVQHWVHLRQRMCRWPVLAADMPGLPPDGALIGSGPLGILALTDDIGMQCRVAGNWIARKIRPTPARLSPPAGYDHPRLKVGYLSSDFCRHAMSYLIAELFEPHDRDNFEIYGYCSSPEDGSDIRRRIRAAFDRFRIVGDLSDQSAAERIRDDEIDILIDLNGLTAGSRLQVLRWRPAPIQATYLGYVGPVPLPELDYIFCDDFVIPRDAAEHYQPSPLAIGTIYQANDGRRVIGSPLTRRDCGLPDRSFVFCCFSNHYKVTAEMFAAWMAILRQVEDSVLWLAEDNEWSRRNLTAAAEGAGIAPGRLIFAARADPATYMARLALADLFLDTFPYNAGTIASDAIRMRLPLVTLCGQAFASRMAARLLDAIGAQAGIAHDLGGYVATAVGLANHPEAYAAYKALFSDAAWAATIGDVARFTREFEAALNLIAGRSRIASAPVS